MAANVAVDLRKSGVGIIYEKHKKKQITKQNKKTQQNRKHVQLSNPNWYISLYIYIYMCVSICIYVYILYLGCGRVRNLVDITALNLSGIL